MQRHWKILLFVTLLTLTLACLLGLSVGAAGATYATDSAAVSAGYKVRVGNAGGNGYYTDLAAAVAGASENDTITILANITATAVVNITKNLTITGEGVTYANSDSHLLYCHTAGKTLTLAGSVTWNGEHSTAGSSKRAVNIRNGATVIVKDNVVCKGGNTLYIESGGGTLTVQDNVTVSSKVWDCIEVNNANLTSSTVTVRDNVTLTGARGVLSVGAAKDGAVFTVNILGGTLTAKGGTDAAVGAGAICVSPANATTTLNISGGTIRATGSYPAVCAQGAGTVNITGGTFSAANVAAIQAKTTASTVNIYGGTFSADTLPAVKQEIAGTTVTIWGGDFSAAGEIIAYTANPTAAATIGKPANYSGSVTPAALVLPTGGKICTLSAVDNTKKPTVYVVETAMPLFSEDSLAFYAAGARIGTTFYETLTGAIAVAKNNDTITVLKSVTLAASISISKNLTFEGAAGVTVSGSSIILLQISTANVTLVLDGAMTWDVTGSYVVRIEASGANVTVQGSVTCTGQNILYVASSNATLTVKENAVIRAKSLECIEVRNQYASGTINIEDNATLIGARGVIYVYNIGGALTINVKGGTLTTARSGAVGTGDGEGAIGIREDNTKLTTVNISGGTIGTTGSSTSPAVCAKGNTQLNITGGTLSAVNTAVIQTKNTASAVNIYGGTFIGSALPAVKQEIAGSTVMIWGGDFSAVGEIITYTVNPDAAATVGKPANYSGAVTPAVLVFPIGGKICTLSTEDNTKKPTVYVAEIGIQLFTADSLAFYAAAARIGTTFYETLTEAITAANNNDTITVLQSVTLTSRIQITQSLTFEGEAGVVLEVAEASNKILFDIFDDGNDLDVTLTLRGPMTFKSKHRVVNVGDGNNQRCSGSVVINIENNAVLISTAQTAIYVNQKPTRISDASVASTAVVNLISGTVTGSIYGYAPFSAGNTTFNMYGGTITTTGSNAVYVDCPPEQSGTTRDPGTNVFNLTGGTVIGGTATAFYIKNTVAGKVTVNISGTAEVRGSGNYAIQVADTGTVNISGGTVTCNNGHTIALEGGASTLNITGGAVSNTSANDDKHTIRSTASGTITISGNDTVVSSSNAGTHSAVCYLTGSAALNIEGGTVERTAAAAPAIYLDSSTCTATVTISGGTVSSATGNTVITGSAAGSGSITVSGGTVTGGGNTVVLNSTAPMTVSGGIVRSTGSSSNTIRVNNASATLTISGDAVIEAAGGTAIRVTAEGATVVIDGGTVSSATVNGVQPTGLYTVKGTDTEANRALLTNMNPNTAHGAIVLNTTCTVTVNGGVVTSTGFTIRIFAPATVLNVNGGRIDNRGASSKDTIHIAAFEAYQKHLNASYSATANDYANCVRINVRGGTIEGSTRHAFYVMSSAIFRMWGGTLCAQAAVWNEYANDNSGTNNRLYQDFAYTNLNIAGGQIYSTTTAAEKLILFFANQARLTIGGTASVSSGCTGIAIYGTDAVTAGGTSMGGNMIVNITGTPTFRTPNASNLIYQDAANTYSLTVTIKGGDITTGGDVIGSRSAVPATVKIYGGTFSAVNAVNIKNNSSNVYLYGGDFKMTITPLNLAVNNTGGTMEIGKKTATPDEITPDALVLPAGGTLFVLTNRSHTKPTCYTEAGNGTLLSTATDDNLRYYSAAFAVYVAQIVGGSNYTTLAAAVSAASGGATIKILCNTRITAPISVTKSLTFTSDTAVNVYSAGNTAAVANTLFDITAADVTLTLEGSVSYISGYRTVYMFVDYADVTVNIRGNVSLTSLRDSAVYIEKAAVANVNVSDNAVLSTGNSATENSGGQAAIAFDSTVTTGNITITGGELHGSYNAIMSKADGTITIENAMLTACYKTDDTSNVVIFLRQSGKTKTLNINEGTVISTGANGTAGTAGNAIKLDEGSSNTVNINGGTIVSYSTAIIVAQTTSTININGGSITQSGWGAVATAYTGCGNSVINITGGVFTSTRTSDPYKSVLYCAKGSGDQSNPATYNIYGGVFNGRIILNEPDATINFYGGRFTATADCAELINVGANGGTVHIYGGYYTYEGTTGAAMVNAAGNINLQGGYIIRGGQYYLNSNAYDATGVEVGEHIITRFNKGAAVRMSGTTEASGLRFISHVDADTISYIEDTLGGTIVGYHTIVFPAKYLAALGGVVTPENIFATLTPTTQYVDKPANDGKISDGAGGWLLRAALINIKDDHYDWDFACIAYVEYTVNGKTVRQCTAFNAENDMRSVRAVANYALTAYENGTAFFNVTQLGLLNTYAGRTAMPAAPAAAPEVTPEAAPLVTLAMPAAPVSVGVGVKQYL